MMESAAGRTGRRRWEERGEERSRPASNYLLGKRLVIHIRFKVIRGNIIPMRNGCKVSARLPLWQNILSLEENMKKYSNIVSTI